MDNDKFRKMWLKDGELLHANRLTVVEVRFCNILKKYGHQRMSEITQKLDLTEQDGNRIGRSLINKEYIQRENQDFSNARYHGPKNVWFYSLRQFQ